MDNSPLYVTVSYAQSIDGRIATAVGDSQYISGPATIKLAHKLRREHEGILVGINTVLRDDPLLTCRYGPVRRRKNPTRVVLDTHLRLPLQSALVNTASRVPTIVFTAVEERNPTIRLLGEMGVLVERVPSDENGKVSIDVCLQKLRERGLNRIFVEGGGEIITAFFTKNLVNRALIVTSPILIGSGIEAIGELGIRSLSQAIRPKNVKGKRYGADYVWEMLF